MKNVIYEYWIDGLVVGIHDLHGKESVTVHAAGVLLELQQKIGSLEGKFVVWRNGDHMWDGFLYRNKRIGMYALGCTTFEAAKAALKVLPTREYKDYTFNGDLLKDCQNPNWELLPAA